MNFNCNSCLLPSNRRSAVGVFVSKYFCCSSLSSNQLRVLPSTLLKRWLQLIENRPFTKIRPQPIVTVIYGKDVRACSDWTMEAVTLALRLQLPLAAIPITAHIRRYCFSVCQFTPRRGIPRPGKGTPFQVRTGGYPHPRSRQGVPPSQVRTEGTPICDGGTLQSAGWG